MKLQHMAKVFLMEGIHTKLHGLDKPGAICIMTKSDKIPRDPTINVSNFAPIFVLQIYFSLSCYTFGLPPRSKIPHIGTLKFLVTTLINQYIKVAFIRVD